MSNTCTGFVNHNEKSIGKEVTAFVSPTNGHFLCRHLPHDLPDCVWKNAISVLLDLDGLKTNCYF